MLRFLFAAWLIGVAIALVSPAHAQQPGAAAEATTLTAEGTLSRIDVEKKLLWIHSAGGGEMQFAYTDQTEIIGRDTSPAGLASQSGTRLRVLYQVLAGVNVAVKIEMVPIDAA